MSEGAVVGEGAATSTETAQPDSGQRSAPQKYSYLDQVRREPDFAASEVQKHQSRGDQAEAKYRDLVSRLGGEDSKLLQYIQQVGPETLVQTVDNYVGLRNNDRIGRFIQEFEKTGEVRLNGGSRSVDETDDEEDYLSPEEKKIRHLEGLVAQLTQRVSGITTSTGSAALRGHLEKFAKDHYLTPQEFEKLNKQLEPQFRAWEKTSQGIDLLERIQRPDGYKTVKTIAAGALDEVNPSLLFELGERKRLREREGVERFATDGPPTTSTTGTEQPPDFFAEKGKSIAQGALEALHYVRQRGR